MDNMKYSNEIDLFESIDQDVSLAHSWEITPSGMHISGWAHFAVMFYFLFSGIQTQAYRPVDLVLFTESSVREILAQVNQRQSKGKFCSLFIVAAVFTIITPIILLRTMSEIENMPLDKCINPNMQVQFCVLLLQNVL